MLFPSSSHPRLEFRGRKSQISHYPNFARKFRERDNRNTTLFRKEFRESLALAKHSLPLMDLTYGRPAGGRVSGDAGGRGGRPDRDRGAAQTTATATQRLSRWVGEQVEHTAHRPSVRASICICASTSFYSSSMRAPLPSVASLFNRIPSSMVQRSSALYGM